MNIEKATVLLAVATILIAVATLCTAIATWRAQKTSVKESLFDRRIFIYENSFNVVSTIINTRDPYQLSADGRTTWVSFCDDIPKSKFIFSKKVYNFLCRIEKSIKNYVDADSFDNDSPMPDIDKLVSEMKCYRKQFDCIFHPYLSFEDIKDY